MTDTVPRGNDRAVGFRVLYVHICDVGRKKAERLKSIAPGLDEVCRVENALEMVGIKRVKYYLAALMHGTENALFVFVEK